MDYKKEDFTITWDFKIPKKIIHKEYESCYFQKMTKELMLERISDLIYDKNNLLFSDDHFEECSSRIYLIIYETCYSFSDNLKHILNAIRCKHDVYMVNIDDNCL